jgi:hypothetical protein
MEIMVQGQMVQEILDYLVFKYKIPLKYCESIYEKGVKAKKK